MRVCFGLRIERTRGGRWIGRGGRFRCGRRTSGVEGDDTQMVLITRKIEVSASDLYHNPALSPEENRRVVGKCNNPHGHGHNYGLEVTVAGGAEPVTGSVVELEGLKENLEREEMERIDYRFFKYRGAEVRGKN